MMTTLYQGNTFHFLRGTFLKRILPSTLLLISFLSNTAKAEMGEIRGHIFWDKKWHWGDEGKEEGDVGLSGVEVIIHESNGNTFEVETDEIGNYNAMVPVGLTTITIVASTLPPGPCSPWHVHGGTISGMNSQETLRTINVTSDSTFDVDDGFHYYGLVEGRVYLDTNMNGVQDDDENGLPGFDMVIDESDLNMFSGEVGENGDYSFCTPVGHTHISLYPYEGFGEYEETQGSTEISFNVVGGETVSTVTGLAPLVIGNPSTQPSALPSLMPSKQPSNTPTLAPSIPSTPIAEIRGHIYWDKKWHWGDEGKEEGDVGLSGVEVIIHESNGNTFEVETDEIGNYNAMVPVGLTTITIVASTLPPGPCSPWHVHGGTISGMNSQETLRTINVTSDSTFDVDDGFHYYGLVEGRVYLDTNMNGVQDDDENGLPGFDMVIDESDLNMFSGEVGENGDYSFCTPVGHTHISLYPYEGFGEYEETQGSTEISLNVVGGETVSTVTGLAPLVIGNPSTQPSVLPSLMPIKIPTVSPSIQTTESPPTDPTSSSTEPPTIYPTEIPTKLPTNPPSPVPSLPPSAFSSVSPSSQPSINPTEDSSVPSVRPTEEPSQKNFSYPSLSPTTFPSIYPSLVPSLDFPNLVSSSAPSLMSSNSESTSTGTIACIRSWKLAGSIFMVQLLWLVL